jgi:hypothetical protein
MARFLDRILSWNPWRSAAVEGGTPGEQAAEASADGAKDPETGQAVLLREEIGAVGCAILRADKP